MSILHLATDADSLAQTLADLLDRQMRTADFFTPISIVVPNRYVGQWLRLWLARRLGVAINLRFLYLENALWELLREVDPRPQHATPELLDHDHYRLMVLALLWEDGPDLAPLQRYLERDGDGGRNYWRRSWHLADRLAKLIRDYEYHRQDVLIQHWLRHGLGYADAGDVERGQREIFERIVRLPDGKRALLEQARGKVLKTLPQYAMEVMEQVHASAASDRRMVHLFGITQISALHVETLHWLGRHFDFRFYHLNPLVRQGANNVEPLTAATDPACDLLSAWGQAGVESLRLLGNLQCEPDPFKLEMEGSVSCPSKTQGVPPESVPPETVLMRLQGELTGGETKPGKLPQDRSVQIAACPGIYREIETIYNSILYNLQHDPSLKQTDVAVLVTDLPKYRPVLQAVFERQPKHLHYNLATISAAGTSAFGQALVGFLDLALESFTRSEVFAVLLNPCVLARQGIDREQALTWLTWAEELGIYHGWDRRDKEERGYAPTPLFSWRLGLQRLRLGRIMESAPDQADAPAPRFQGVIPYADLASGDREQLDGFCRAVEGLLPALASLRKYEGTGTRWAEQLRLLVDNFLAVPPDRPEEAQVRDRLLESLSQLALLDHLQPDPTRPRTLPLALIREFVITNLEALEGSRGDILTGGVTIAALASTRPVPFRIVYIAGLGEDLFPGPNNLPTFDLRAHERRPGDIRPAETNRFLFLEAIMAARDKLYLLYNSRELQRDQELQQCVPLAQLRRHLTDHVCEHPFEIVQVPLSGNSAQYLEAEKSHADILVNCNESDRLLALSEARRDGRLQINEKTEKRIDARLEELRRKFEAPAAAEREAASEETLATIRIDELKRFLLCPAEAALRRHLRLQDEEDLDTEDEEPFWTDSLKEYNLVVQTLEWFVQRALGTSLAQAETEWRERFAERYEEWRLRCRVPEGVFAELEQSALSAKLEARLTGNGGLADFLREHAADMFVGPILIGESVTPVNARRRFPAVKLEVGSNLYVASEPRLVGSCRLAWRSKKSFDLLVLTNKSEKFSDEILSKPLLEPLLFLLALRAGDEKAADGVSSADWLERLPLNIHVAHAGGIARFTYLPREISPREARRYLTDLAVDFLNSTCYDLLPFELILRYKELFAAYMASDEEAIAVEKGYADLFQDVLEQDSEGDHPAYRTGRLMAVAETDVPTDAFDKIRRRFRLLDRGPARNREQKAQKKDEEKKNGKTSGTGSGKASGKARSGPARRR